MKKKVTIIGSGFSGLSAAASLANAGLDVMILEKNSSLGGRARKFEVSGFTFDMGPSWYWLPEVFENFYQNFGFTTSDFYELKRLDPSYKVVFPQKTDYDIPAREEDLYQFFESLEKGSAIKLKSFLKHAKYKYETGMNDFVWKPSLSLSEFIDPRIFKSLFDLNMFSSISSEIREKFKHPHLREILEFPVLFLGAKPKNTPALYSLMNYADLILGTWYPMGGMNKIIEAMVTIAKSKGVRYHINQEVSSIEKESNGELTCITKAEQKYTADFVVASADYEHVDQNLLPKSARNYTPKYWDKRIMAPSSLLFYIGVNKKIAKLKHHNLFFDASFQEHAAEIYDDPKWPNKPLFYVCCPSKTDITVAPEGHENMFLLVPLAPNLEDNETLRTKQYQKIMKRLFEHVGEDFSQHIIYKKSFCLNDFKSEYNSFKGNAYGLANTLWQTAFLKPKIQNKNWKNLFYTGQLTAPGPGVPPSIISGQVIAKQIVNSL